MAYTPAAFREVRDLASAAEILHRDLNSKIVLLRYQGAIDRSSPVLEILGPLGEGLDDTAINLEGIDILGWYGEGERSIVKVEVYFCPRILLVLVRPADVAEISAPPGPSSFSIDSLASLLKEALRSRRFSPQVTTGEIGRSLLSELREDLGHRVRLILHNISSKAIARTTDGASSWDASEEVAFAAEILEARIYLRSVEDAVLQAFRPDEAGRAEMVSSAVSELDSISQMLNSVQLLSLQALARQSAEADKERTRFELAAADERERQERHRDRSIAHIATTLIFPTLWFAFLGANVFPENFFGLRVASESAVLISVGGAVLSAVLGYVATPLFYLRKGK